MSKKKYIVLLCLMALVSSNYYSTLNTINDKNTLFQKDFSLKSSGYWVLNSTIIDNTGGGDYTWSEAETEDWCSGSGSLIDPFVIKNVTIDAKNVGSALSIRNSNVYFRIENCTLFNATNAGIELINVNNSEIIKNNCSNNGFGISLDTSFNNEISSNFINNNSQYGIVLDVSGNNIVFNNTIIWNTVNAIDNGTNNDWDNGVIGNYWSDYDGMDLDNDGIGDNPYTIPGSSGSQDNFPLWDRYIVPGVDAYVPPEQIIKIGFLNDLNIIRGDDSWKGAYLAAKEINEAGGVLINGSIFYIGLLSGNTFEGNKGVVNVTKGINAANYLISNYNPHFLIGGSNPFALSAYIEPIMDAKIPFINTGVVNDIFSQNVLNNYTRYKYFFNLIINSSELARELITFELYLSDYLSDAILGRPINKMAFLYNINYPQMSVFVDVLKTYLINHGIEVVKEITIDETETKDDFKSDWDKIDNAGAQLALLIGFTQDNLALQSQAYGEIKPRCLILSITDYNFIDTYWDDTEEGCEYEIACPGIFNIPRTSRSIPYWNNFLSFYGFEPTVYAGIAYNAIYLILNATLDSQSLSASKIVESLEKIDTSNTFPGVGGKIAFTSSHSLFQGTGHGSEGYGSCMMGQWQAGGSRVIIHNYFNLIYPDSLVTGSLQTPDWGINLRFTINTPTNNAVFDDTPPDFNIEILDVYEEAWYTINSGPTKYAIVDNGTVNIPAWDALSDGPVRLTFYCNDSSGHIFKRYVDVIKDTGVNNYYIPGVEEYIPLNQTIKVGILADLNDVSGDHAWKGGTLAAKEINEAGGVLINGSTFYIGLISENTYEYEEDLNVTKGVNAAINLISNYNPDLIIGGTVYDAVSAYLEPIMDAQIPFINLNTVGYTTLTQNVQDNYARYKYLFQLLHENIGSDLVTFQLYLMEYLNGFLGRPINRIALLYEDRYLGKEFAEFIKDNYTSYGYDIIKEIVFDSSTTKTEFKNYWNEIDNAGVQFAYVMGHSSNIKLISQAYGEIKPRCLVMNTFRNSTIDIYWEDTNGKCEYEINVQAAYNISRTARTIPFWNEFVNEYGHEPSWWGIGYYESIYLIENATLDSQSLNPSDIINSLEKINTSHTYPGICGTLAFASSHAPYSGLGYGSSIMCQWRSDGTKVVLPNGDLIYYDTLSTGGIQTPDWGINIRFTINSPNENDIFEEMAPAFNIEILDPVDKMWYTLNSGLEKHFFTNNETIEQLTWENELSDGPVKITFYANDTYGHIFKRYVTVIKDTLPPNVTVEPMETTTFGSEAPTIILDIQDATNITESYYSLDGGITKIPFTGNEVTINQTLWDELGEGTVEISFYIIDSVGRETIIYVEVEKELPGAPAPDNFLFYIIIGVIALVLGVVSTIAYTQHRRKKKRKTEWVKLKKKKGLISPELAEGKNLIFISYATKDSDLFQISLITDILVQYPEVDDILYWESDMHDDIYEYMDDNLKLCSVFLLFCTENSLYSEPVKMEWRSALKLDKKIIPIFINPNDIPPLLTTKLGVQFNESEVYDSIETIYQMILKKLELTSSREFCRYLIPKSVSEEHFEEQVAPMVKKDIEIESDIPTDDLETQFISILEKNNFQFLKKPKTTEEIEKSESQLIYLRFFAEDKFEKQEIGLTATIQKVEDYKSKVYLRVMGNKEWMVNEILRDLGNKLYPLKTATELLRDYSGKIDNFIDQIDNLEEFLRKNFGVEMNKIEDLMHHYLNKEVDKDDFIKKGFQILGKQFILVFIENLPKISQESIELGEKDKEIDI